MAGTSEAIKKAKLAKAAAPALATAPNQQRSQAISAAARIINDRSDAILEANAADMDRAKASNMKPSLLDRLLLTPERLASISDTLLQISCQDDPLGRVLGGSTLDAGPRVEKVTVPLGVVAMIYEARPNVTADAFGLCIRSGNACVLKGGSAAEGSCLAIVDACRAALVEAGLPADALQYVADNAEHTETQALLTANGLVDLLIPRGGAGLIQSCIQNATVPTIETGTGNCHIYLHKDADPAKALRIVVNAKTSRPGVCNSAESLLVDDCVADELLPNVLKGLAEKGVELVGDERACAVASASGIPMEPATEEDWGTEYLELKMSVACVTDVNAAIAHINKYGTGHSECIVSESYAACEAFLAGVDAAAVYANASTRFTDGGVFGLGAEIGISTQKLHARGPMGAEALTTTKYLVRGGGEVR